MQPIAKLVTRESPRQILAEDFKSIGELPIRGGWGYSMEDACVIDKNDPVVPAGVPFDVVGVEYAFVEKRIYEEMIIFREEGQKFSGIKWSLLRQKLLYGAYDVLEFEITAFPEDAWEALREEWEGPNGICNPNFDIEDHVRRREASKIRITREFWFEILSAMSTGDAPEEQERAAPNEAEDEFRNDPSDPDYVELPSPEEDSAVKAFYVAVDKKAEEYRKLRQKD